MATHMKRAFNPIVAAIMLVLSFAAPVAAGQFEDAVAAYQRGDYATALRLLRPLADQGNAVAQYNPGFMYDKGQGVPQDYAEAAGWYHKAADEGDAEAQTTLGVMYAHGQGVPQDFVSAHMWFNLAAARGGKNAEEWRAIVAQLMTLEQIAEAQKLAREWKPTKQPDEIGRRASMR